MSNAEAVQQWIDKALNDNRAIEILNRDDEPPIDAICFHCQQYIEKLIKAIITKLGQEIPKTHDIRKLAEMVDNDIPELTEQIDLADRLTIYGVETRYPARFIVITREKANQAIKIAEEVGNLLLKYLGETNE